MRALGRYLRRVGKQSVDGLGLYQALSSVVLFVGGWLLVNQGPAWFGKQAYDQWVKTAGTAVDVGAVACFVLLFVVVIPARQQGADRRQIEGLTNDRTNLLQQVAGITQERAAAHAQIDALRGEVAALLAASRPQVGTMNVVYQVGNDAIREGRLPWPGTAPPVEDVPQGP